MTPSRDRLPEALAAASVLCQVAYPLTPVGGRRHALTVVSVVMSAAASVGHAAVHRGWRFAAGFAAMTAGAGLGAELLGTATGVPFGRYAYSDTLGRTVHGVPVVIPLAWTAAAYPAYVIGLLVGGEKPAGEEPGRPVAGAAVAAVALAAWDVFLDPQMVAAGHWTWLGARRGLPGVPDVPLTNYAGWLVTAAAMMSVVCRVLPTRPVAADRVPQALYAWTFASSTLANAVFWRRPAVAGWGALAMGPVVVALGRARRRGHG